MAIIWASVATSEELVGGRGCRVLGFRVYLSSKWQQQWPGRQGAAVPERIHPDRAIRLLQKP